MRFMGLETDNVDVAAPTGGFPGFPGGFRTSLYLPFPSARNSKLMFCYTAAPTGGFPGFPGGFRTCPNTFLTFHPP
jgi:hypothetical protein